MLYERADVRGQLGDVFAAAGFRGSLPKYRIPQEEHEPTRVYQYVHDELMLDGNARQNLATFCQTWAESEAHDLMDLCFDKNLVDKDEYPRTADIESRCVHMIADLWNAPDAENTIGTSTTGSSEAAMLAGMAMLRKWRAARADAGKTHDRPNIVTGPVQVCWHKFARYWDIELREVPMEGDRLIMGPEQAIERVDENTIGVVTTFGVTFTGQYEPVAAIAAALDDLQVEKGLDVPLHVDAASGGFLAPFTNPDIEWDFRLSRVKSINASGHKFGLAPLGVGWVVWRDTAELPKDLIFYVNYLGGNKPTLALNFSRPGGQVVVQYYNFLRLGRDGYRMVHEACYKTARYLAKRIRALGPFELIYDGDPAQGIPAVSWRLKQGSNPGFNLFDLADRLRTNGWLIPAYALPADRKDLAIQRLLVKHGFTSDMAELLMDDVGRALKHFADHPVTTSVSAAEGSGFSH